MKRGGDYFTHPASASQRRYEALRTYLHDGQPAETVAETFGYTPATVRHPRGQAVDIFRIDDVDVIDDRQQGSRTCEVAEWFYDQPEDARIGSPWALDNFGGRSFADVGGEDHLHIAVER